MKTWSDLQLKHVFYAYRKAKADCFFDHVVGAPLRFAAYEKDIARNLRALLERLRAGEVDHVLDGAKGEPRIVAKKLDRKKKSCAHHPKPAQSCTAASLVSDEPHAFFSDAGRAIKRLRTQYELTPEFRLVGDFEVEYHIVSALWVNQIGHKFDACLDKCSYGARVRRHGVEHKDSIDELGDYALNAVGSLWPYVAPYRRWRSDGMKALRSELEAGRPTIAVTLDIANFYHQVDPSFIVDAAFHASLNLDLSDWERAFTQSMCVAFQSWAKETYDLLGEKPEPGGAHLGLPIGLTAARVVANLALIDLDRAIKRGLNPIHYGRYVDDMLIIMNDPGHLSSGADLLDYVVSKSSTSDPYEKFMSSSEDGAIQLHLPYSPESKLTLQPAKQRVFFLAGQSGLDLIDTIEWEFKNLSSERRLMPLPGGLEKTASAMVLAATDRPDEEAVTFGRSNGLTIRRLGWAVQLRAVETLAAALPKEEWKPQRQRFYKFACDHVIRADKLLEQMDSLARLVALAASLSEWDEIRSIRRHLDRALTGLEPAPEATIRINAFEIKGSKRLEKLWKRFRTSINEMLGEAILRATRPPVANGLSTGPDWLLSLTKSALPKSYARLYSTGLSPELALAETDLAVAPYKEFLRANAKEEPRPVADEESLHACYDYFADLDEFLRLSRENHPGQANRLTASASEGPSGSLLPYLFPTRPYDPEEVSLYLPDVCLFSPGDGEEGRKDWARFSRAMKGASLPPALAAALQGDQSVGARETEPSETRSATRVRIGAVKPGKPILLGIPSLLTRAELWERMASGTPAATLERFERIERVVNMALTADPRPTYLILPELSLPEEWLGLVSSRLLEAKISLIAGLDYKHDAETKSVNSSAALVLFNDSLAFSKAVQIRQSKAAPAPGEELDLLRSHGLTWSVGSSRSVAPPEAPSKQPKPIYIHNGLAFGLLICSELQNMKHRVRFQGEVDLLVVLSWNQDLKSFEALVDASALDIHAYVALVNNRLYGGSRVRVPARETFHRELCHIHGGQNDQLVVVELDVAGLRKFQSRRKRWPKEGDRFKPVPEDFELSDVRRRGQ